MCLLFLLSELRERLGFSLSVIHVNHGIRGEEALRDAELVRDAAKGLGIPFTLISCDVPSLAAKNRQSLEEAGRAARYQAFEETEADRVAVAHHAEDVAETLLFHLFRGTGIRGMGSIRPVRGKVIRPLLHLTRPEIESYLRERQIPFQEDSTNRDDRYSRNRIRHRILPEAEKINANSIRHLLMAAEKLQQADVILSGEADRLYEKYAQTPSRLSLAVFDEAPPLLSRQVILKCIAEIAGGARDVSETHLEETASLKDLQSGSRISLPYGITAVREFGEIRFQRDPGSPAGVVPEGGTEGEPDLPFLLWPAEGETPGGIPLPAEGALSLPGRRRLAFSLREIGNDADYARFTQNSIYTKCFDYDRIKGTVVLRTRCPGDRISLKGGSKKLKDLLIEAKVPLTVRDRICVLAAGSSILWIPGLRMGDSFKITEQSRRVWMAELMRDPE